MNAKVKNFLDSKAKENRKQYESERDTLLRDLNLVERVYSPDNFYSEEYYMEDYDEENNSVKYYKTEPIKITDEEYEEIKKALNINNKSQDSIATTLVVIAILIYILGTIFSFVAGKDSYGDLSAMCLVYLFTTFITGTFYLGFAEIIKLLQSIKDK